MSEYLPFWPKAAMGGYIANGLSSTFYTKALPTNGFTEVVVQVQMDATFGTVVGSTVVVTPQISNDGANWKDLTAMTTIAANGTFPAQVTTKFTDIGAFMRMKVVITYSEGAPGGQMCATIFIAGAGRS
jgi:hypothetical protein